MPTGYGYRKEGGTITRLESTLIAFHQVGYRNSPAMGLGPVTSKVDDGNGRLRRGGIVTRGRD